MWDLLGKLALLFVVGRLFWSLTKGIYSAYIAHILKLNMNLSKTGKWAVVTGATDGIGKAYCFELAKRGLNIVLISRTTSKLQAVAEEIKKQYPIETKIITADFTTLDIYDKIEKELKDLDIGVLLNNVGMGYDHPEYITKVPDVVGLANDLLNMNIQSVNRMTFIVLPGMEKRKRGIIINISSLSGVMPTPFISIYGATKAYVDSFSKNLDLEMTGTGVSIQCVFPGFVATNLSKMTKTSATVPSPKEYVRQAVNTVGVEKRTAGFTMHKLMFYGVELLEFFLPGFVMKTVIYNTMFSLRNKALRKMAKAAKNN